MELPLTPSARPRRASRRSSGGAYGTPPYGAEALTGRALLRAGDAYGTSLLTGRASLRDGGAGTSLLIRRLQDEPPYGTERRLCGRRLRDEPPYGPEALTGRASLRTEALTGRAPLRDELLRGGTHARASLRTNLLYGPEALTGGPETLTGQASLREAEAYGTEALGRASLRAGGGGAYGTSPTGRSADYGRRLRDELLRDDPPYGTEAGALAGLAGLLRRLRDEPAEAEAYGTEALTGRASLRDGLLTGRRRLRLRDEPPYGTSLLARRHSRTNRTGRGEPPYTGRRRRLTEHGTEALGRASLRAGGGDAYGTSLHGRRLRDEPPYARDASLRAEALIRDEPYTGRRRLRGGGAYGTSLLTERASCAEALMDEPHYERNLL